MNCASDKIPASFRWISLAWLTIWIPAYWHTWGAVNFLHLCDVAVFLTCVGFIFGNPLLISSQAVASLLVDATWVLDAAWRVAFGHHLLGGTEYMFDGEYPLWVRMLSLFHIAMPVLLLWTLRRTGYDRRGLLLQCAVALPVFVASRLTDPALNINYAFTDPFIRRQWGPAPVHVVIAFLFMVIVVYVPTHFALAKYAEHEEPL